ncbi:MAG: UDP-N-acetylmuramoyl-L-alanine--D-glutamate ligase [Firmicutes bacterium HGW-Firmicutes-20]|nr:MAG: UDP-N-acetylmuramoyl-L-alanine--D-glutamate ligase [Firmicutes bacterium HGW-Firmicutes-20]
MKKVLIIGAARSGLAIARLLRKEGFEVILTDIKPLKIDVKEDLIARGIEVVDGGHPDSLIRDDYTWVIKNPGISHKSSFIEKLSKKTFIYNEIEIALRFAPGYQVGAITGTNGKTTVTTLLGEILAAGNTPSFTGGNIGLPISEIVEKNGDMDALVACEIAAFQLIGTENFKPRCAVIMNLSPDHLDVFTDLEEYYQAKTHIFKNMDQKDVFLVNLDDPQIVKRSENLKCRTLTFSYDQVCDCYVKNGIVWLYDEPLFELSDLQILGRHNTVNAMVAGAMAYVMGIDRNTIRKVISLFKGVEHRIEFVREYHGVKYYNDSKGTNTDATIIALKSFDTPVILLAGGYDKHTGFEDLRPYLHKVSKMIVFGATKHQLKLLYPQAIVVETLNEAVLLASQISQSSDTVLFSPACASYDQFDNYEQRGRIFKNLVNNLE